MAPGHPHQVRGQSCCTVSGTVCQRSSVSLNSGCIKSELSPGSCPAAAYCRVWPWLRNHQAAAQQVADGHRAAGAPPVPTLLSLTCAAGNAKQQTAYRHYCRSADLSAHPYGQRRAAAINRDARLRPSRKMYASVFIIRTSEIRAIEETLPQLAAAGRRLPQGKGGVVSAASRDGRVRKTARD